MTLKTHRYNFKSIFWGISQIMMIFLCLCATRTFQSLYIWKLPCHNSDTYGIFGLNSFWKPCFIFTLGLFALIAFVVFLMGFLASRPVVFASGVFFMVRLASKFTFVGLTVACYGRIMAYLALTTDTIFHCPISVKIRYRLKIFAFRTPSCYALLRHGFFLTKELCLGPSVLPTRICGSSHTNTYEIYCKQKINILLSSKKEKGSGT